jgi:hypothetical protein
MQQPDRTVASTPGKNTASVCTKFFMADPAKTISEILQLIHTAELASLGPKPRVTRQSVASLDSTLDPLLQAEQFSASARKLIRALVLLWHDHLDASHSIAQEIRSRDGSYVHGIMHRREPDYGNARYWFHRVGDHPCFATIGERVRELDGTGAGILRRLAGSGTLDPFALIELCEEAAGQGDDSPETNFLQRVQQIEFEALLAHVARE